MLLSGWGAQIDPAEARARGADFIVAKPIDFEELHHALVAASRKKHERDEGRRTKDERQHSEPR